MSDDTFEKEKKALITIITESPKTLFGYNIRLWREIDHKRYYFNRDQNEVNIIKDLTKNDVIEFYEVTMLKIRDAYGSTKNLIVI